MTGPNSLGEAFVWWKVMSVLLAYGVPFSVPLLRWQARKKVSLALHFRNPSVVFCVSIYALIGLVLETLQMLTPHGLCIVEYFSRGSILSFLLLPLILRAAGHVLLMDDRLRRRFSRFISHKIATKIAICFGAGNMLVFSLLFFVVIKYPSASYVAACVMESDAIYPGLIGAVMIPPSVILTFKLKGELDVYGIAQESRMWFYMAAALGFPALALNSMETKFFGFPSWRLCCMLFLMIYLGSLLLLLVRPLWIDRRFAQRKKELSRNSKKYQRIQCQRAAAVAPKAATAEADPFDLVVDGVVRDPKALAFFHRFARARFVPEVPRFLRAAHCYRAAAAARAPTATRASWERLELGGSDATAGTAPLPAWPPLPSAAAPADGGGGDALRVLYRAAVAEFLAPGAPYELNLDAAQSAAARALCDPGAWAAAGPAGRAAALEAPRVATLRLFADNYRLDFLSELAANERGGRDDEGGAGAAAAAGAAAVGRRGAPAPLQRARSAGGGGEQRGRRFGLGRGLSLQLQRHDEGGGGKKHFDLARLLSSSPSSASVTPALAH
mmetsp:Transcript_17812/g.28939  ORF Transcript_17812/g.28939 Transcript_17812/m.28939 type:complete len:556 (-) Transcript_17812:185-1852(-)